MDFALYLGVINEHLLARGRPKANPQRVREYFKMGMSAECAEINEARTQADQADIELIENRISVGRNSSDVTDCLARGK